MSKDVLPALHTVWSAIVRVGRQLSYWAVLSIIVGAALLLTASSFLQAVGVQFVVWGAIDGLIAWLGLRDAHRKRRDPHSSSVEATEVERRRVVRLLRINAGLDVGYLLVGAGLLLFEPSAVRLGHAVGILIQGGFLFVFDVAHAITLSKLTVRAP